MSFLYSDRAFLIFVYLYDIFTFIFSYRPDPRTILENEKAFVVSKPALSFKINERIEQLATPVVRN